MKKILLAIVLILALAVIGIPFISGLMMERSIRQSFNEINKMYADTGVDITFDIDKYERGYSSSQIDWKIKIGVLKQLVGLDDIQFVDTAKHGFTRVVSHTSLEKNKWFSDVVKQELGGVNPLKIVTEYSFFEDIKSTVTLDRIVVKRNDEILEIMPARMIATVDKGFNNYFTELIWEGLNASDKIQIEKISGISKLKRISNLIWTGNVALKTEKISGIEKDNRFEVENFKSDYTSDYNQKDNALSFTFGYGADQILFGPDPVKNALVKISVNGLDAKGYEDLIKLFHKEASGAVGTLAKESPADQGEEVEQKQMAALGLKLMGAYEKLLRQGLEIQLSELRAQLPQGDIKGKVSLSLKKNTTFAQLTPIIADLSLALDFFSLSSDIKLPYKLIGDNPNFLEPIIPGMQTGLFVLSGEALVHTIETRDGKLFLNGNEVDLQ